MWKLKKISILNYYNVKNKIRKTLRKKKKRIIFNKKISHQFKTTLLNLKMKKSLLAIIKIFRIHKTKFNRCNLNNFHHKINKLKRIFKVLIIR